MKTNPLVITLAAAILIALLAFNTSTALAQTARLEELANLPFKENQPRDGVENSRQGLFCRSTALWPDRGRHE